MRKALILIAVSLALAATTASAQYKKAKPAAPSTKGMQLQVTPDAPIAPAKRITLADAIKLFKSGQATFVDVRSIASFADGHIKGALSIPQSRLQDGLAQLPPKKMIVTYCACPHEESAALAVLYFNRHGLTNTAALVGGWKAWQAAGQPVE